MNGNATNQDFVERERTHWGAGSFP